MDWEASFWAALGLVLVIEGVFPFVSPAGWRRIFTQILQLRDGQIRFCALLSIVAGGLVLLLL
ncbi:hypothetical protein ALDI51_32810 [Alicycliphilus denitrificans]|uniref:DUF2065 domain-containing protein n=1 Tax=Alicycliphilus denitrificans TaxID=179636 RepID=UPI000965E12F|nr:DUF2065 domain-containing protein [Alicycliphilus denitrificans]MBN9575450.1 DUF2065 domain-containing protein [Alicycliphilus denitrificans]OJW87311.1 MAG: DUF2065 domain-containing protein [Alicycliphilus sp. 69-12]BCN39962.1 hypothetical protein ALDI51_32810 [Alicycliphilus denitrificans]